VEEAKRRNPWVNWDDTQFFLRNSNPKVIVIGTDLRVWSKEDSDRFWESRKTEHNMKASGSTANGSSETPDPVPAIPQKPEALFDTPTKTPRVTLPDITLPVPINLNADVSEIAAIPDLDFLDVFDPESACTFLEESLETPTSTLMTSTAPEPKSTASNTHATTSDTRSTPLPQKRHTYVQTEDDKTPDETTQHIFKSLEYTNKILYDICREVRQHSNRLDRLEDLINRSNSSTTHRSTQRRRSVERSPMEQKSRTGRNRSTERRRSVERRRSRSRSRRR
jgi:hypothetical protein